MTAEPLERERAFSSHINHMRSTLARSRTQSCIRFYMRERRKYASRDQSSRPSLTRKDGPVYARFTGMVWRDENALYKTNESEESGFRTYTHGTKKRRGLKLECHSTAGCARIIVIICVKTRRSVHKTSKKATRGTIEHLLVWCGVFTRKIQVEEARVQLLLCYLLARVRCSSSWQLKFGLRALDSSQLRVCRFLEWTGYRFA